MHEQMQKATNSKTNETKLMTRKYKMMLSVSLCDQNSTNSLFYSTLNNNLNPMRIAAFAKMSCWNKTTHFHKCS